MADEFPFLDGADTMVVVSDRRNFRLHSIVLKQSSGRFANLLAREGAKLTKQARKVGIRYHLVLQNYNTRTGDEIEPTFRRVDLNSEGRPFKAFSVMHEAEEDNVDPKLYIYYENIFASWFGIQLTVNTIDMATAMEEALGLIKCAEYLDCMPQVTKSVDNALFTMGQELYHSISIAPVEWIDLGYRLCSKVIFKESLIHLVGRYNQFKQVWQKDNEEEDYATISTLRDPVREVVELKRAKLEAMCQEAEQKLVTFYPPYLRRESTFDRADRDDIGRQSYGSDVFGWVALGLYRHWFGQAMTTNQTHQALDGGYDLYKRIYTAGTSYLDRAYTADFHLHFPMTQKGKSVVANHIETMKAQAKDYVKPLMKKESSLNADKYEIKWLTCVKVDTDDFPWERRAREEAESEDEDEQGEFGGEEDLKEDFEEEHHVKTETRGRTKHLHSVRRSEDTD